MDIDYLNEFLITAKHRNVSEAARELNLSQPALSRHIASLESAVGATLFDRSTNPMELTEVGKEFQDHAWALYSDWLRLEAFMKTVRGKTFRTVRVAGVLASGAHHVVRQAQALLRQKEPYVSLSIEEVRQQTSFSMVREGTLDVAVEPLSSFVDAHGLKSVPLVRENAAVVVEAGHPLAKRERLDVDDLRRLSFTSLRSNRAYALRYHVREIGRVAGLEGGVPKTIAASTEDSYEALLTRGLGEWALMLPESMARRLVAGDDGYRMIPFGGEAQQFDIRAFYLPDARREALEFVACLEQACDERIG